MLFYFLIGFFIGSQFRRYNELRNYKYYEALYNSQQNEINKYKKLTEGVSIQK